MNNDNAPCMGATFKEVFTMFLYEADPTIFASFGVCRPVSPLEGLIEEYQFLKGLAADIVYYGDESADYAGIMDRMEQIRRQILAVAPAWKA